MEKIEKLLNKGVWPFWIDVKDIKRVYKDIRDNKYKIDLFSKEEQISFTDEELKDFILENSKNEI